MLARGVCDASSGLTSLLGMRVHACLSACLRASAHLCLCVRVSRVCVYVLRCPRGVRTCVCVCVCCAAGLDVPMRIGCPQCKIVLRLPRVPYDQEPILCGGCQAILTLPYPIAQQQQQQQKRPDAGKSIPSATPEDRLRAGRRVVPLSCAWLCFPVFSFLGPLSMSWRGRLAVSSPLLIGTIHGAVLPCGTALYSAS